MLRYLTERLPVMVTPRWVHTRIQPIAVRDVLRYLVGVAGLPADVNRSFDVGGSDVLTYRDMMLRYAEQAGLRRRAVISVPVLSPGLSSLWVGLVTPVPGGLARPLVESLRYEVVCRDHDIAAYVPDPPGGLLGFDESVRLALVRIRETDVATRGPPPACRAHRATRYRPTRTGRAAASTRTDARPWWPPRPRRYGRSSRASAASRGWYSFPLAWAARGCAGPPRRRRRAAPGPTQTRADCASATPWTFGGWRRSSRDGSCGYEPRCACPGWPGWS